nr:MAG TPA: hypothetical protein [Caudoviricetes sp.]
MKTIKGGLQGGLQERKDHMFMYCTMNTQHMN